MRIKQLEVIGFKSFAQRTVLDFPTGITAIVGPNGCGKSNVVDAIRWVLGEQSPKHLRGNSMEDVIFKGNDRNAPLGMAQVSLTFENNPEERQPSQLDLDISTIPAHIRELSEITISRRYFRSGESEYAINKMPCRLKDITELFLGTGVGSKAYAIIEQGRVEQLVNAKPEDRRLFIEEAAGTTLYRSRKLAAERKMERTRENLLRVSDVLRELERQIQYLHRLAKKADQFRSYQDEARSLDLLLSGVQRRRLRARLSDTEQELRDVRRAEEEMVATLGELDGQRRGLVELVSRAEEELSALREQAAVLENECQGLQHRVDLLRREAAERSRRVTQMREEVDTILRNAAATGVAREQEIAQRDESAAVLREVEGELARTEALLAATRQRSIAVSTEVESLRSALLELAGRQAEYRNQLQGAAQRKEEAQRRHRRDAQELAHAASELAKVERLLATRRLDVIGFAQRLHSAKGEMEAHAERVRSLAEQRRFWEGERSTVTSRLLQVRSRLDSLREIQQNCEGYQRGVRSILREAQPDGGVLGVVADVLEIPAEYERAVAAALGERLQYVIVRDGADGVQAVSALRGEDSGRGSFIPLAPRRMDLNGHGSKSMNGGTRRLIELIKVQPSYEEIAETLLGEVVLVPDLNSGLGLWRRNGVHVTMVTPDGDTIDASGVITGGSERPVEEEIVARRRMLLELQAEADEFQKRFERADGELKEVLARQNEAETALRELDRDVHSFTLELVTAEKELAKLDAERPRWVDKIEACRADMAVALREQEECDASVALANQHLLDLKENTARQSEAVDQRQAQKELAQKEVEGLASEVTALKVRAAEGRQRHQASVATLVRLEAQIEEAARREQSFRQEQLRAEEEGKRLEQSVVDADEQRLLRLAERDQAEAQIHERRSVYEARSRDLQAHEQRMEQVRNALETRREGATRLEVAVAEQRLRLDHLAEGVQQRHGVEIPEPETMPTEEEEISAASRLEVLREKLGRMGEVNIGAIDELRDLEERAVFLRTQRDDLERSLGDLEKTIQRLNRASRTKFAETFAAVNEHFQRIVPRLFRGGEARLVLTDEGNLLESGVEIVVRPPGKKLETMTLLSGGEKALVAVSLIFSLFLINPTPFCFLDEVDAPLDDANIGRFTELVQEMSSQSQFIVITHNKRTMQAADVMYGVTMQEPGLSKVISVNMHS